MKYAFTIRFETIDLYPGVEIENIMAEIKREIVFMLSTLPPLNVKLVRVDVASLQVIENGKSTEMSN